MSRIEKGSQRFRPTVVSRRVASSDTQRTPITPSRATEQARDAPPAAPAAQASPAAAPAPVVPGAARAAQPIVPPAGARSYAFAPSRTVVPRARDTAQPIAAPAPKPIVAGERAGPSEVRAAPARTTSLVTPGAGRAMSAPPRRVQMPAPDGYQTFLHAAQTDPSLLRLDPALPAGDIAAEAAVAWQEMSEDERRAYGTHPGAVPPIRRARLPSKRRAATSISDDEAEYNAQCAAHAQPAPDASDAQYPPLRVDIGATRMESIAVTNWKSGRASSRTFELERVRARQLKKRRQDADSIKENPDQSPAPEVMKESGTPAPLDEEQSETQERPTDPEFGENRFAVQTRIVDGKIVLDEQSLYANYRDEEQQAKEQRNWEVIDEREGDQFVNSASRSKQRRTQRWSAEETERFFQAISQWGTDFEMITRLFPHRTRREIKSKWTKESRQNPKRLDDAFSRRVAVDLTAYGHAAGVDLSGPPPEIVPKAQEVRALEKEEGGA